MKVVSVILARGGSKGIPKKNLVDLNSKPLISHTILRSHLSNVEETWVSTDDKEIKEVSEGLNCKVLDRPDELCLDTSSSEEALLHFANNVDFDVLVFIQPTSPLLLHTDINKGLKMVLEEGYDSVFSCLKQHWIPEWSEDLNPLNFDIKEGYSRRQDKQSKLIDIGAFYVIKRETLLENKFRLGGKIGYVELPLSRSFQVDDKEDLKLIEKLMK